MYFICHEVEKTIAFRSRPIKHGRFNTQLKNQKWIETLQAINEREYNVAQNIGIDANSKQRTLNIEKQLW